VSETYEEIDFDTLITQQKSLPAGRKFESIVRLNSTEVTGRPTLILFKHPENFDHSCILNLDGFDKSKFPSSLAPLQKVVIRYTTGGPPSFRTFLDSLELLPLPEPPAGYEEIDLFDFNLGNKKSKFEVGKKFWSHTKYNGAEADYVKFGFVDQGGSVNFSLTRRLPKMADELPAIILYTVAAKGDPELDDVLI
jgi:hypothetical protein